jgi:hypothetical protein
VASDLTVGGLYLAAGARLGLQRSRAYDPEPTIPILHRIASRGLVRAPYWQRSRVYDPDTAPCCLTRASTSTCFRDH